MFRINPEVPFTPCQQLDTPQMHGEMLYNNNILFTANGLSPGGSDYFTRISYTANKFT
jgi:hypothetical protein